MGGPAVVKEKVCFVMMPISNVPGYAEGHFDRAYKYLIRPACERAGYKAIRADEVRQTNYIVIDILRKILDSQLVVCDLSAKNPNVLYELGIRQAFNKPVALIKDSITERVFDIQGLRQTEYDATLRVDTVERDVQAIADTIKETAGNQGHDVNSLIQLLGIQPATASKPIALSDENKLVLSAIQEVTTRLSKLEQMLRPTVTGSLPGGLAEIIYPRSTGGGLISSAMNSSAATIARAGLAGLITPTTSSSGIALTSPSEGIGLEPKE